MLVWIMWLRRIGGMAVRRFLVEASLMTLLFWNAPSAAARPVECWFSVPAGERADCRMVEIPAAGGNGSVEIAAVALKTRGNTPSSDPVLFIEGGPGASPFGNDEVDAEERMDAWWSRSARIRGERDLILFDPRGVGRSRPSGDCPEMDTATDAGRIGAEGRDRLEAGATRVCAKRMAATGLDPTALSTALAASDAFAVGRAYGATALNLLGVSYGTRVALAMMREPAVPLRAVVLDGVYPPDVSAREEAPRTTAAIIRRILADCAANRVCRGVHSDLEARFLARIKALGERPLDIRVAGIGRLRVDAGATLEAIGAAASEGDDPGRLPGTLDRVAGGRLTELVPWLRSPWFADPETAEGVALSIECRENIRVADPARLAEAVKRLEPMGAVLSEDPGPRLCADWPGGAAPPSERTPVASPIPTLALSGAYDAATPPEWGDRVTATLSRSKHVVYRARGHMIAWSTPRAAAMVADFFHNPDPAALTVDPDAAKLPVFPAR